MKENNTPIESAIIILIKKLELYNIGDEKAIDNGLFAVLVKKDPPIYLNKSKFVKGQNANQYEDENSTLNNVDIKQIAIETPIAAALLLNITDIRTANSV